MTNSTRRTFLVNLGRFAGALSLIGWTRETTGQRVPRIGFMSGAEPSLIPTFEEELVKLGYTAGKNIHIEMRIAQRNTNETTIHAAELAAMDLDFVVVAALPQALAMRQANPKMPMVIITCPGMVSNGFAASMERPGGIYTGLDELPPGVTRKRLQLLKRAAPSVSRIALLSTTPGSGLRTLRHVLVRHREAATPWLARNATDVLAMIDMTVWTSVLGLLDECPIVPEAMTAVLERRTTPVRATAFEFISTTAQIGDIRIFMKALPSVLSR